MLRSAHRHMIYLLTVVVTTVLTAVSVYGQEIPRDPNRRFQVSGGVLTEAVPQTIVDSMAVTDSIAISDSISIPVVTDIPTTEGVLDTMSYKPVTVRAEDTLTRRELRLLRKATDTIRYSKLFRDTIPISRVTAISVAIPGFAQVYNKQAWKVPILYGSVGVTAYYGFQQNKRYKSFKRTYDDLVAHQAPREEIDPVQKQMIKHNTARTVLFIGAIASYVYFLSDGVLNYDGPMTHIKKATTLSTIFPGLGQIYNKSYWKVPIVIGAFATMGYVIDFNSRGYKRFKTAYELRTDGDPTTVDEFANTRYTESHLQTMRNTYRRNRDLSIIATAGLFILNIIDAHVDAHMKDYDISDDLVMSLEPTVINYYTMRTRNVNGIGLSLKINF